MRSTGVVVLLLAGIFSTSVARAYTVTSAADSGAGTLRAAITAANAAGLAASIDFNIPGCAGVCRLVIPSGVLPTVDVPLVLDGYTQPGASPNTLLIGNNAIILIELDFANTGFGGGLSFSETATGSLVRGLAIIHFTGEFGVGISMRASGAAIEGNFVGVDASGTSGAGGGFSGIYASGGSLRIGGQTPAQRNLIGDCMSGIASTGGGGTVIEGNYVGTNAAGTAAIPNIEGVRVFSTLGDVTIGGTVEGSRNVISGNIGNGIAIGSDPPGTIGQVTIQGNWIGSNAPGTAALPNRGNGIHLMHLSATGFGPVSIGGTLAGARNVISGNGFAAFSVGSGISTTVPSVSIQGNFIGTDPSGTMSWPNAGWGVEVVSNAPAPPVFGNATIGGSTAGAGNVIAAGGLGGIRVWYSSATIQGNSIGTAADGKTGLGNPQGIVVEESVSTIGGSLPGEGNVIAFNLGRGVFVTGSSSQATILGNQIFDNGLLGIDLGGDGSGVQPNDPGDADVGPNTLQNFPMITDASISNGTVRVQGVLMSGPGQKYRLEFFASSRCHPSGYGEGQAYLGALDYDTDETGNVTFDATFVIPPGLSVVTMTATDENGNTSEFSPCSGAKFYSMTPCRIADTRDDPGPYGGPSLSPSADRTFVVAGRCGVPVGARSVVLNLAVTNGFDRGDLRVFQAGVTQPLAPMVVWNAGQTRSSLAVIPVGSGGDITIHVEQNFGTVDLILDTSGYFQ